MTTDTALVLPGELRDQLWSHLFPGDDDEHGAVMMVGTVRTARGVRLLARDLLLAEDGVDYVESKCGYRRLRGVRAGRDHHVPRSGLWLPRRA
jgi:hypothetical protein